MVQEHSFFSRPLIYFGSHQNLEDDDDGDPEEWNFSDPWQIFFDAKLSAHQELRIGLFIHWSDVNE